MAEQALVKQTTSMVPVTAGSVAGGSQAITRTVEAGLAWVDGFAELRRKVLQATNASSWVLIKDRSGNVSATLTINGANLILAIYPGLRIFDQRIVRSEKIPDGNGEISTVAECSIINRLTGAEITVQFAKTTAEAFGGRQHKDVRVSDACAYNDHISAVRSGLVAKAVGTMTGLRRVPLGELAGAWAGTGMDVQQISRGHGFKGDDKKNSVKIPVRIPQPEPRQRAKTKKSQQGQISESAKELAERILGLAGGDKERAADLLGQLTAVYNEGTMINSARDLDAAGQELILACLEGYEQFAENYQFASRNGAGEEGGVSDV